MIYAAKKRSLWWVLRKSLFRLFQTSARRRRNLRPWVDNRRARAWLRARLVHRSAVLGSVANEWQRLRPALDLRSDGAHPLGGGRADAAAIVPRTAVARRPPWFVGLSRASELRVRVNATLVDWP